MLGLGRGDTGSHLWELLTETRSPPAAAEVTPSTKAGATWEQPCPSVTFSCPGVAHVLHQGQVLQLRGRVGPHRGEGHNREVCDPYLLSRTFGMWPGIATSMQAACLCHCVPPEGMEVSCTACSRKKEGKLSSLCLSVPTTWEDNPR